MIELKNIKSIKNQRNFEDVSSESAFFENSIKITRNEQRLKIGRLSDESAILMFFTMSKMLNNQQNFEDVSSESAIFDKFKQKFVATRSLRTPPSKTKVKAIWPPRHNIVRYAEMKTSRARAQFITSHQRVQNVCATEENAAGAGQRTSK